MRPDEEANRDEIERDKRFRSNINKGVGTAATIGAAGVTARVLPFLSKFIPVDLAMKGLSKVSPKLADFLKRGQSMGLNIEEGFQYVRDSISSKEKPKDNKNIIEQYSPELHQFIDQEIKKGRRPIEAGALAQNDKSFSEVIKKLSKDHKTPWSNILESIYGQEGANKTPDKHEMERQSALKKFNERKKGIVEQESDRFQNEYGNQSSQAGRGNQMNDPLFQALMQGDSAEVSRLSGVNQKMALNLIHNFNQKQGQQQPQANDKWDPIAKEIQDLLNS